MFLFDSNLKDITFRAVETLEKVDLIYAEDTRVTAKLLSHYNINKQVSSYHSFNEKEKSKEILSNLEKAKYSILHRCVHARMGDMAII